MYDLASLVGIIALSTVIINILKMFGVVKDGEGVAKAVNTILTLVLTGIGMFFPDLLSFVPAVDELAQHMADLGGLIILAIPIVIKIGNTLHDWFTGIPLVNKVIGYQLTP